MSNPDLRSELPTLFVELSMVLCSAGSIERAEQLHEGLQVLRPDHQVTHFVEGVIHSHAERHAEAEKALRAALAKEPDNRGFQTMLVESLMAQEKWDESKRIILDVLDAESEGPVRSFAEQLQRQLAGQAG